MMMIQISERKKEKMSELVEGILHDAGKLMQCVENLDDRNGFGERRYGMMGQRSGRYMGMSPDEDWDEDPEMGERWNTYGDRRGRRRYYR